MSVGSKRRPGKSVSRPSTTSAVAKGAVSIVTTSHWSTAVWSGGRWPNTTMSPSRAGRLAEPTRRAELERSSMSTPNDSVVLEASLRRYVPRRPACHVSTLTPMCCALGPAPNTSSELFVS